MQRKFLSFLGGTLITGVLLAPTAGAYAQNAQQPSADNSRVNKQDRNSSEPTADQAKNDSSDVAIMRKIRRAVVRDKSLSTYAHNVKIISEHGKVTLRGPVHSEEEKKAIEAKATQIAGDGNVTNELTVKSE